MGTGSPTRSTFLTACWRNLILANYAVPESLLRSRLPPGLELDTWDGQCWASLVGFQFLNTRVRGISCPGYRNFPEWNLRFYVRQGEVRGVCFVREFVPRRLVAWVARTIYNEPYQAAAMSMSVIETQEAVTAAYTVQWAGRTHTLSAVGDVPAIRPNPASLEHWFKEHSWGFGLTRRGRLQRYAVNHPEWDVHPVRSFAADVDWGLLYGPEWAVMNGVTPASVVLAVGSPVSVYPSGTIR